MSTSNICLKPWKTIKSQKLIEDLPWLKVSVDHVLLPNGKELNNFYQIYLPEYAVIVAQTQDGFIIMEHQYKHAVGKTTINLPAGYLNLNESPLEGAQRELLEETGFKARNWHYLGSYRVDGNRGCGRMNAFVATGAYPIQEPDNEETEELEVILKKPEEALQLLVNGEIVIMGSALALSLAFLSPLSPIFKKQQDGKNDYKEDM
jgi:ADP-ribose pyrophosphatase